MFRALAHAGFPMSPSSKPSNEQSSPASTSLRSASGNLVAEGDPSTGTTGLPSSNAGGFSRGDAEGKKKSNGPPVGHNGVEAILLFNPTLKPPSRRRHRTPKSSGCTYTSLPTAEGGEGFEKDLLGDDDGYLPGDKEREGGDDEEESDAMTSDSLLNERIYGEGRDREQGQGDGDGFQELSAEEREQEAKIVFYFPSTRPPEEKRSHVGLIEGLIIFTKQFSGESGPLRCIFTDEHIIVTREVEPDYWLSMVFNTRQLGVCGRGRGSSGSSSDVGTRQSGSTDGSIGETDVDTQEYLLTAILNRFYNYFRLLHGRFVHFLESEKPLDQEQARGPHPPNQHQRGRQQLRDLLEDYCPAFIDTIDPDRLSLFHAVEGFHFGPLDRLPFLHLPSFVSILQNKFPCIRHTAVLLNGCLLFHDLDAGIFDLPSPPLSSDKGGFSSLSPSSIGLSLHAKSDFHESLDLPPSHANGRAHHVSSPIREDSEASHLGNPQETSSLSSPARRRDQASMNGFGENDSSPQGQEEDSWFRGGENESEQGEEEEEKKKKTAKASSSYPSLREEEEEEEEKKKRKRYDDWLRRNLELEEGGYNIMKILYSYLVHSQGCATVDPAKLRKPPYGRVNTAAARPGGGYSSFGRAICERDENSIIDDSLGSKTQGDSSSSSPPPFLFGPAGRSVFMPVVHLPDDTTGSLVVINEKRLQLVLILTEDSRLVSDVAFLQHIRSFALEAGLADLEQVFGTEFDTIMKQEDAYRFIYFNHINHAVRVSNRACPSYAPSPPMYEGCPLTKQEVRRMAQMHRHLCVEPRRHRMDAFSTCDVPSPLCDKGSNRRLSVDPHTHTGPHEADHHTLTSTDSSKLSKEKVTSTHNEIRSPLQRASSPSRTSDELHSDLGSSRAGNRSSDSSPSRQELSGDVSGHRRHAASSNEHNGDDEHERAHRSSSPVKGTESGATTSGGNVRVKTRPAAIKLLAVKDGRCGWLLGSASMNREFYVALDDSKTTLTKAMEDGSRFEYMHFANIFV